MGQYAIIINPRNVSLKDMVEWPHGYGPYSDKKMVEVWDRIHPKIDFDKFMVEIVRLRTDKINTDHYSNKGD